MRKVSLHKARAVLWEAGWGRTGGSQSDDGFRLQKMRSDGMKLVVTRHRFDSDAVRRMRLPTISKDAAWVQDGPEVLAVQLTHRGGAVIKEDAHELLAALLTKGQDDTPLYREVKPPAGSPTMARIEKADGKLRIAKSAVDAVLKGLQAAVDEDTTIDHQSERPVGDERQIPITATLKSTKGKLEVLMHCAEEGDRVVPTAEEAGVGGAIALKDRCALIVWSGRDARSPSDPDASEALLRKLLGI